MRQIVRSDGWEYMPVRRRSPASASLRQHPANRNHTVSQRNRATKQLPPRGLLYAVRLPHPLWISHVLARGVPLVPQRVLVDTVRSVPPPQVTFPPLKKQSLPHTMVMSTSHFAPNLSPAMPPPRLGFSARRLAIGTRIVPHKHQLAAYHLYPCVQRSTHTYRPWFPSECPCRNVFH